MIQYFNRNSVNVDLTPAWQTLSCVYNIKSFLKLLDEGNKTGCH